MALPTNRDPAAGCPPGRRARGLCAGALALLVVGGCSWLDNRTGNRQDLARQQQEQAEQQRQQKLVQECRGSQAALRRLTAQLQANTKALEQLAARRYTPLPRPLPPADAVLQRYTISDQELELERHQQALQTWRARESWRRRTWLSEQASDRRRIEEQRRQLRLQLAELQPAAVGPAPALEPQAAVLAAYGSCDPQALASLNTSAVQAPSQP